MDSTWINAPAKINIGLDVLSRREDGYHEVKMIMQSVRLFDRLTLKKTAQPGIHLVSNLNFLPVDESNLVYQAAKLLMDEFQIDEGLEIFLDKRIPVAAGMAGGSTDAASCMLALNRLFGLHLSKRQLMQRGIKLGADIPYCVRKGTALSRGIGEIISSLPKMPDCFILLAKPGIHVSTRAVYTDLVLDDATVHPDIDAMIRAMKENNLPKLSSLLGNLLETVTIPKHPEIDLIKKCMVENGALGALMSGSGPTVFGIFDDSERAYFAREKCRELPFHCFVFVTDLYR